MTEHKNEYEKAKDELKKAVLSGRPVEQIRKKYAFLQAPKIWSHIFEQVSNEIGSQSPEIEL